MHEHDGKMREKWNKNVMRNFNLLAAADTFPLSAQFLPHSELIILCYMNMRTHLYINHSNYYVVSYTTSFFYVVP